MQIRVEKKPVFPGFFDSYISTASGIHLLPGFKILVQVFFLHKDVFLADKVSRLFIRNRDQMRIWKSNSVCIKHLFDGKAHSALHFPLLHRLYLADNSDIDTGFSQIGNSLHKRRFLNELCIFLRILVDCSLQKLYDFAGIRLIGSGNGNRGHRSSLVIVDDTGDGSVWNDDLVTLGRAKIGHSHGSRFYGSLNIVDLDIIPDRKLIFKNHEHSRYYVTNQVLGTKTDCQASDSRSDQKVIERFSHSQDAQHDQKNKEVDGITGNTSEQGHQRSGSLCHRCIILIFFILHDLRCHR